jgi:trimethylamine--corrinoid protein Co-methyltransferase
VDKLLFCADRGIPSTYCPSPVAGGTAPITTAGQITLGLAEALCGLVMHQLRAPGAPFVIGQGPNTLDMATSQSSYNSPEFVRAYACEVEMAKWLDIPNWGFSGHTDAQVLDAQAGMEADELTKLSMQLGANLNHDVGYMDFGLSGSLAEVVLVAEFIARNRRLLAEIEVSDETLAVDVLEAVGPGGDFLGQRHTRLHLRSSQWRATLLNRMSHERWLGAGASDVAEKARRRALELLTTHETPALPDELRARLDAVVAAI